MSQIKALVQHKDFDQLMSELDHRYYEQWKLLDTPEEREKAHVKVTVLGEVRMALINEASKYK